MKSSNDLRTLLRSVDHKSYPAYKSLGGSWQFPLYTLVIDHVQGDPFASPSALHAEIPLARASFPENIIKKIVCASRCRTFSPDSSRNNLRLLISKRRAPAKAVFYPSAAADRRCWSAAPAR